MCLCDADTDIDIDIDANTDRVEFSSPARLPFCSRACVSNGTGRRTELRWSGTEFASGFCLGLDVLSGVWCLVSGEMMR